MLSMLAHILRLDNIEPSLRHQMVVTLLRMSIAESRSLIVALCYTVPNTEAGSDEAP